MYNIVKLASGSVNIPVLIGEKWYAINQQVSSDMHVGELVLNI